MSLRETIERIRSNPVPVNEETAKFQILAPILSALSWDPSGQDVLWEHPVGSRRSGGKVDIALQADDHIWALIEAKAPGTSLDSHVEQVLRYAHYEGVDICALSDGLRWWLYLPRERGSPEARRFAVLDLTGDPVDQVCDDLNAFLSRESLVGGSAVTQAEQVRRARREAAQLEKEMPRIWAQMLDEPDEELIDLVRERVYEKLSLRPGRDQILAAMRNRPIPPVKRDVAESRAADPPSPNEVTAVMLWGERHPVARHSDILLIVVEELYKQDADRFEQTVAPLTSGPWQGHKGPWQYASLDRRRVPGQNPKRTPSGCFVNVHMTAATQRERWTRLLEAFGHSGSDLQLLYEETTPERLSGRQPTKRPDAVRLWGERHAVRTHVEVLMTVIEELHERHPDDFDRAIEPLRSGKAQWVSRDRGRVRATRITQTPSGHYVDINLSARRVKERAYRLLEALGHDESDLVYLYE